MKTYIGLLRGINVGGHKKIKMADLKICLEKGGLSEVTTYIQSGNIVFKSKEESSSVIEEEIASLIKDVFSWGVLVCVITPVALKTILEQNPYREGELIKQYPMYYALLQSSPSKDKITALESVSLEGEYFKLLENCVYFIIPKGFSKSKCSNNFFEKKLGVSATRNLKTLEKLLELAK